MTRPFAAAVALGLGWLIFTTAPARTAPPTAATDAGEAQRLTATIDRLVAAQWQAKGVKPAPLADDAEYLRRVYLDLTGRIPPVTEVRDFIDDTAKDKRAALVERLLRTDAHADQLAAVLRARVMASANGQDAQGFGPQFQAGLQKRFKERVGYDRIVRDILTANPLGQTDGSSVFFTVNEQKPENVASAAARLFLGVKLECAQCHNHPFADWKRAQFWEFAAFFAEIGQQPGTPGKRRELSIPGGDKTVRATFLDGKEPKWEDGDAPRAVLADWITAPDNPYFARATVNHLWEYFFGVGLIEPLDEPSKDNPPSHPELLDELAKQFVAHRFDLDFLVRAITGSRAYQLTSKLTDQSQKEPRTFGRMAVRSLTAEQLFDSLAEATGAAVKQPERPQFNFALAQARGEFLARFPGQASRTDAHTSILQALYLMNGKVVADATTLETNKMLADIAESKTTTARRIRELYMVTLSRLPTAAESEPLVQYVDKGGTGGDAKKALADVYWALLNSSEFFLNH